VKSAFSTDIEAAHILHGREWMETLWHDLRYSFRLLARKPAFTIVALLALAIGIGANSVIFSVVNSVLLRPLPYKEPDRLVMVWEEATSIGFPENTPAPANFIDWRDQNRVFESMAATASERYNITGDGEPEKVEGLRATASLFPMLGVEPIMGRWIDADEDREGANRVVMLSYGLWQRRFGGDAGIIGKSITLDDQNYTVIAVMPSYFNFPIRGFDLWIPAAFDQQEANSRGSHYLEVYGRLKEGVTIEQARADMSAIAASLAERYPGTNQGLGAVVNPLFEQQVGDVRPALLILFGAVGFVLAVACANVANLLLARAAARRKEISIRAALGAGRARLVRQFITESVLLAVLGGIAGLALALASLRLLIPFIPEEIHQAKDVSLDFTVVLFTFGVSALTGIIFGLVPAIQASRPDLNESLKDGARDSSSGTQGRLRNLLVVSEVALALVLLAGAGLLINSFARLSQVDPGFRTENLLTMTVSLPATRYPDRDSRAAFFDRTLERISSLPGVESAGVVTNLPLTFRGNSNFFVIEGRPELPPDRMPLAVTRVVNPDYLRTMGISLAAGRGIESQDTRDSLPVAVITEATARIHWPGEDPIGKRMKMGRYDTPNPWLTVVGIARDVHQFDLTTEPWPQVYLPYTQHRSFAPRDIVIKTTRDPLQMTAAVRNAIWDIDRDQPVSNVSTMADIVSESLARQRFNTSLLAVFAFIAVLLAAVGIYGVMSYLVTERTREIGIRSALGADRGDILRMVVWQGFKLVGAGVVLGLAGALALSRVMTSLLYGVSATDPATFAIITAVIVFVALIANSVPAYRAAKIDPMEALRHE